MTNSPSTLSEETTVAAERPAGPGPGGGESPAAAHGREMHEAWDYGPGFEKEARLPSGSRVDAVNWETHEVVELKPNNLRAIRLGERQILRCLDELNEEWGGVWTGGVETYQ